MPAPVNNQKGGPQSPVMKVTRYEQVSSGLIALVAGITLLACWEVAVHFINRPVRANEAVPVEMVELPGGEEDGAIDETLLLDSPDPETVDPSLAEVEDDTVELEETLDNVIELADTAVEQSIRQYELDAQNSGNPGSASGTGRRALGVGPGKGGVPRDQRWFVRYGEQQTSQQYAKQLEYFGIVLGALRGNELIYLSDLTKSRPTVRKTTSGKNEKRLYMTWQGGRRRAADEKLFMKAGIDVTGLTTFQFIPKQLEEQLAKLERDYRGRPVEQIRRTYFTVNSTSGGYEFAVTRQIFYR